MKLTQQLEKVYCKEHQTALEAQQIGRAHV